LQYHFDFYDFLVYNFANSIVLPSLYSVIKMSGFSSQLFTAFSLEPELDVETTTTTTV